MRPALLGLLLAGCHGAPPDPSAEPIAPYDALAYVDPLIGTGGPGASVGSINPGAVVPWGMVQAGPASRASYEAPFYHCAGYYYEDTAITGFGHTFAHGMGATEMGGVLFMPKATWAPAYTHTRGRLSAFTHDREWASPGYYAVDLQDDGIHAELTASRRGALHRYTFPADLPQPTVLLDLAYTNGSGDAVTEAWVHLDPEGAQLSAFQRLEASYSERFGGLMQHVQAAFDPAPVAWGTWVDPDATNADSVSAEGPGVGAWLVFPAGTTEVRMRLGLSYVDSEGAAANLQAELPDFDFDAARARAEAEWHAELDNVRVRPPAGDEARAERDLRIFHTAQYHTYQMPRTYTDVDGRYRGLDGLVHDDPGFAYHSDFSGWDTFRTQHPWLTLAQPHRQREMVQSLVQMVRDGGSLPRWPLAHGYTGGMIGTPMAQVLAGSYLKDIQGWDTDLGWDAAVRAATTPQAHASRGGVEQYVANGFVTYEATGTPAANTLEYAWSDAALGQWGRAAGKPEAAQLEALGHSWRNMWEPESAFFWGRHDDGSFTVADPLAWTADFVEGNAWQYVWMVPQDPMGMVELQHGGDVNAFLARYDDFWAHAMQEEDGAIPEYYYWHGNEPDLHYPFLGSLVGAPDHTAVPARYVLESKYRDAGWGLDGNDDGGTLSAWYLLASIGLFPVAGTVDYAVGSPIFERVEIDRSDGLSLVVRAPGTNASAPYVQSAELGGESLDASVVTHQQLLTSGELVLHMGPAAAGWGRRPSTE